MGLAGGGGSEQPAAQAPPGNAASAIAGTIAVDGRSAAAPGAVLFLIARADTRGPPLAVRRLAAGPFPMDFEIGPEHVMIPGRPFAGPIQLSARLDSDGDALTRSESDLESDLVQGLEPGARGIELVLRER